MTWKYIFFRLAFLLPTLFVVCLIAFLLKNMVPGDQVETILTNQGMNLYEPNLKNAEYEKVYRRYHLDQPLFYFSILPHHYPKNIHAIVWPEKREETKSLLRRGYPIDQIETYLSYKEKLLLQETDTTRFGKEWAEFFRKITFEKDPSAALLYLKKQPQPLPFDIRNFAGKLEKMESEKMQFFWPKIHWFGNNNQFHNYLTSVMRGDFGTSTKDGRTVISKIGKAIQWTATMIILSMIILFLIAIPLGLWSGRYENGALDKWTERISIVLYAIPVFWLASIFIIFFTSDQYSKWLNIFPSVGTWYENRDEGFLTSFFYHSKQLILPVLCLILNDFAFLIKLVKTNTIQQKKLPYIKVAIAKGLNDQQILFRHLLPNVGVNIISVLVGIIPAAFAGSLIVEVIFNMPGMGRLLYNSILSSDWNVVYGILLVLSALTILFNVLGDILFVRLNPKIRYDGE